MELFETVAEYVGIEISSDQVERLIRFRRWLLDEALPAGGIGPAERERLDRRHIADSMVFGRFFPETTSEVWDLGTGVGLPGVPLAILFPDIEFRLVDRSGRRIDLVRRACRVLDLANVRAEESDIFDLQDETDVIVSRASLPPPQLLEVAKRHVRPGGTAIAAGSWTGRPAHEGWETVEIPPTVLDHSVWLLIMRRE